MDSTSSSTVHRVWACLAMGLCKNQEIPPAFTGLAVKALTAVQIVQSTPTISPGNTRGSSGLASAWVLQWEWPGGHGPMGSGEGRLLRRLQEPFWEFLAMEREEFRTHKKTTKPRAMILEAEFSFLFLTFNQINPKRAAPHGTCVLVFHKF